MATKRWGKGLVVSVRVRISRISDEIQAEQVDISLRVQKAESKLGKENEQGVKETRFFALLFCHNHSDAVLGSIL